MGEGSRPPVQRTIAMHREVGHATGGARLQPPRARYGKCTLAPSASMKARGRPTRAQGERHGIAGLTLLRPRGRIGNRARQVLLPELRCLFAAGALPDALLR